MSTEDLREAITDLEEIEIDLLGKDEVMSTRLKNVIARLERLAETLEPEMEE